MTRTGPGSSGTQLPLGSDPRRDEWPPPRPRAGPRARASWSRGGACFWVALAWLTGCDGPTLAIDAATPLDGASVLDAAVEAGALPTGVSLSAHAVNLVDPDAAREVRAYIRGDSPELLVGAAAFYAHFDDEYDFLYVFTDAPIADASAFARFTAVRVEAMPSIGIERAYTNPDYGNHPQLRGAVGVNFTDVGNGPTIHETLHYWGTFLDPRFGFGRDADQSFGAHWGVAGVHGQHGGFDASTVRCSTPTGAPPPCSADPDGVIRVSVDSFGPTANGGDALPYAPIELYLMGLLPRAEVPDPILVFDGAHFVSVEAGTERLQFEITGTHTVSMDEIVAVHGERPSAPATERSFRAAFVCFSDAPLSPERMDALERWASIFGNDTPSSIVLSFEGATSGRATMSTRLGAIH